MTASRTASRTASTARPSAQDAFIGIKGEIDELLAKLTAASDDHFGADPDTLNWGHVGNLSEIHAALTRALVWATC